MENMSLSLQLQQPDQYEITNNQTPPPQPPHTAMLHSVRKLPAKPWKRPQPPPLKVYHVDPRGFRKLVQKLTGSTTQGQQPIQETKIVRKFTPPPPLALAPRALPPPPSAFSFEGEPTTKSLGIEKGFVGQFWPSMYSPYSKWCSFPLLSPLSPGTMASLELSNSPII